MDMGSSLRMSSGIHSGKDPDLGFGMDLGMALLIPKLQG